MNEENGKPALIVENKSNHEFTIGTKVLIYDNPECEGGDDSPYIGVSIACNDDWWYLKEGEFWVSDMAKLYTEGEVIDILLKAIRESKTAYSLFDIKGVYGWWEQEKIKRCKITKE